MATKTHQAVFAPNIAAELMAGNTQTTYSIKPYLGKVTQVSLAHLVACDLCDTYESPLRAMLAYIGARAKAGDAQALEIVTQLANNIEAEYGTDDREPFLHDRHSVTSHEEARIQREPV